MTTGGVVHLVVGTTFAPQLADMITTGLHAAVLAEREFGNGGKPVPVAQTLRLIRQLTDPGHECSRGDLVTVHDYAQLTGTPVRTVRRRCERGQLDAVKVGSVWVIHLERDRA
jgi:hypothetical protein